MSTIGQVRRMLRIQALEAAKREDYRTRTRVQKIYIKDKITRNITIKEITHFPKKEETPAEVETQVSVKDLVNLDDSTAVQNFSVRIT